MTEHENEKKSAAPLKANVPTVKSPKLPARKGKLEYFEFDVYAKAMEHMMCNINALADYEDNPENRWRLTGSNNLPLFYREFAAGREAFERDEYYRERKKMRPDLNDVWTKWEITRRVVTEKVGLLIGGFPNAGPHNPEAYMGMLIEEIIAANPRVSVLEATCRELRRSKNFAPSIAEVLKELKAQANKWYDALEIDEGDIEHWQKEHENLRAASRAKEAKAGEAAAKHNGSGADA
jgi:hypothetical protein